ncbi:hypothetical protein OS493_032521 [Desmophyllum pertusum]|uniref:Uncharacterized protein n=1 Tax=Desmophyllum pertusum TaxID=174260 RepID=A0A9W9Z7Z0_9CNID|nr:hypothetical protein OS493_032521 [Desmophyllum pertusum]
MKREPKTSQFIHTRNKENKGLQPFPLRTVHINTYFTKKNRYNLTQVLPVELVPQPVGLLVPLLAELLEPNVPQPVELLELLVPRLVELPELHAPQLVELLELLVPRLVELLELLVSQLVELTEPLDSLQVELLDLLARMLDIVCPPSGNTRGETRGKKIFRHVNAQPRHTAVEPK